MHGASRGSRPCTDGVCKQGYMSRIRRKHWGVQKQMESTHNGNGGRRRISYFSLLIQKTINTSCFPSFSLLRYILED